MSKKAVSAKNVRVNLEVSPQVRDTIKELREKSDASSLAEVFKRSLALYEMVLDHVRAGGKLVLEGADGNREVIRIL